MLMKLPQNQCPYCRDVWEGRTDAANFYLISESKVTFMKTESRQLSDLLKAHLKVLSVLCNPFNQLNTAILECYVII